MMNDKDLKEFYDLDKLKNYNPLPSGVIVADSGIDGQGLFTNRRLVAEEGLELTLKYTWYEPRKN